MGPACQRRGKGRGRASAEREGGRAVWPDREGVWAWGEAGWAAREESEGGEGLGCRYWIWAGFCWFGFPFLFSFLFPLFF